MMNSAEEDFVRAAAAFKTGHGAEGAELLRRAAFAGHAEAQNQLARIYFAQTKRREDLGALESAALQGDHVALFVLAMCLLEGRVCERDSDKALAALQRAAQAGNLMAGSMLGAQQA
ncbi:MAG: hypothetical protein ACI4OS_04825 [Akkermansia sp.]